MKNNCLRFAFFLCCVLLINLSDSYSASPEMVGPPFLFNPIDTEILEGTIGCVPVEVEGIEDVSNFQLGFDYDPSVLRFESIASSLLPVGTDLIGLEVPASPGSLTVIYTNFLGTVTFPDNTVLFELCFETVGNKGDNTTINLTDLIPNGQPTTVFTPGNSFFAPDVAGAVGIAEITCLLDVNPTVTAANCLNAADGSISLDIAGGIEPYNVFVEDCITGDVIFGPQDGGAAVSISNTLSPGDYCVTVSDNSVPSLTATLTVTVDLAPGATFEIDLVNSEVVSPECPGFSDGSITVQIIGGVEPFTYTFEGTEIVGPNGLVFPQLFAGDYTVSVTDAVGCDMASTTFVVEDPESINVEFTDLVGVSCFEGPLAGNGSATATPSGGNGLYIFTWESEEMDVQVAQSTANLLMGGAQSLLVQSGNCTVDTFVVIDQPDEIMVDAENITRVSCFGGDDGSIELNVSGGTGALTIDWGINGTANPLTNLVADLYTVTVMDDNFCSKSVSFDIDEPDSLNAFIIDIDNINCNGDSDGLLASAFEGGTGSVSYEWSTSNLDTFSTLTALGVGDYVVTVTDSNGCIDTAMATIVEPIPIVAAVLDPPPARCNGEQTEITVDNVTGGNGGPFFFTVNAGPTVPISNSVPVFAGEYTVSIFDSRGCRVALPVVATEPPPVLVSATAEPVINLGGSTFVFGTAESEVGIDSIFWLEFPGDSTLSCYDCLDPTASPLEDSEYELFAVDANGCMNSATLVIDVDSDRNVFIPNVFTPNIDGINDLFSPFTGVGVTQVQSMNIYNRWGAIVFSLENFLPGSTEAFGWDGRSNGKDASPGVYYYLIRVDFIDGVSLLYRGDVTLVRG